MVQDAVMDRLLDDWGWWVRDRRSTSYRCRSVEGRYLPPAWESAEKETPRTVNAQDCMAVERTVCSPGFPKQQRGILQGWYVRRVSREKIAGKLGIPRAEFEHELAIAVTMLRNKLDKCGNVSTIRAIASDKP